ncbi:MAG: hypothetical protein HGA76_02220 [Candidatus Firestonebacteria bacterium]|nr:hypothetical protein [Candidatus Firestonebacteria bacterium]
MSKLENLFFHSQSRELLKKQEQLKKMEETKESLRSISGIHDDVILQKLVDLNIRPDTLASLALVPCIMIAWADGRVDAAEKKAALAAVGQLGWNPADIDYALLEHWLKRKPPETLFEAWQHYVAGTCGKLSDDEIRRFKHELLAPAGLVAKSSGGFLGLGKISPQEKEMLLKLEQAFTVCRR